MEEIERADSYKETIFSALIEADKLLKGKLLLQLQPHFLWVQPRPLADPTLLDFQNSS